MFLSLGSIKLNGVSASPLRCSHHYDSALRACDLEFAFAVLIRCDMLSAVGTVPGERTPRIIFENCHPGSPYMYQNVASIGLMRFTTQTGISLYSFEEMRKFVPRPEYNTSLRNMSKAKLCIVEICARSTSSTNFK